MPEVSEIALSAEILEHNLKKKYLIKISFPSGRYSNGRKKPNGFDHFEKALKNGLKKHKGFSVEGVDSKGKFLWFKLKMGEIRYYVMNTFGLTGMWSFTVPKHCRAIFKFSDGTKAYYSDQLNFGTFKFTDKISVLSTKLKQLGPDFLKEKSQTFHKIQSIDKPIATILTDQKKIGSGIGNYLIAEILYMAKISPHRKGVDINDNELETLIKSIRYMVKLSYISNHIGYMTNLEDESQHLERKKYLNEIKIKKKDMEFQFKVYRQKKDPLGNTVNISKMHRRSIHWVKKIQK